MLVIVNVFIIQTVSITRGTSTMIGVPETTTFLSVMIWVLIFIVVAFVFQQSRFGLRLRASRENERAARSVGVRVAGRARDRLGALGLRGRRRRRALRPLLRHLQPR